MNEEYQYMKKQKRTHISGIHNRVHTFLLYTYKVNTYTDQVEQTITNLAKQEHACDLRITHSVCVSASKNAFPYKVYVCALKFRESTIYGIRL